MAIDPMMIVLLTLGSVGGAVVMLFAIRASGNAKQAQRNLAMRNHWQYSFSGASGGSGSTTTFSDPAEGWTLTIYAASSSSSSANSNSTRWSMFDAPGLAIPQGMAVLGPEIPAKTAAMADKMIAMMGGDIGRFLLDKITGGLGTEAQDLRSIDSEGPGHLMASPGAETALDGLRFAPELNNARVGRNEMQQPIVMRGPFGLRVRLSYLLRKPAEIEEFIALCQALADNLKD